MREEVNYIVKKQMALARMLAVRLTDADPAVEPPAKGRVKGSDLTRIVRKLDELCDELNTLVGGTPAFTTDVDDYQAAIAYAAYCDRALLHDVEQKRRR